MAGPLIPVLGGPPPGLGRRGRLSLVGPNGSTAGDGGRVINPVADPHEGRGLGGGRREQGQAQGQAQGAARRSGTWASDRSVPGGDVGGAGRVGPLGDNGVGRAGPSWSGWLGAAPAIGNRIERPGWMQFEAQQSNLCAVHALNHVLQGEFPRFSEADLRAGADLARHADWEAGEMMPVEHEDATGFFSSEAVGRALGRRRFDWRGLNVVTSPTGVVDAVSTVRGAFAPVPSAGGGALCGIGNLYLPGRTLYGDDPSGRDNLPH